MRRRGRNSCPREEQEDAGLTRRIPARKLIAPWTVIALQDSEEGLRQRFEGDEERWTFGGGGAHVEHVEHDQREPEAEHCSGASPDRQRRSGILLVLHTHTHTVAVSTIDGSVRMWENGRGGEVDSRRR